MKEKKFIFKDETSNKFWNIKYTTDSYTVTYGKVGSKGVEKTTSCLDVEKEVDKLIASKVKKGYKEELELEESIYTDALIFVGEKSFSVGNDISSKICRIADEGNEAWDTHLIFHDAWHDFDIDFSNVELSDLAKRYGYTEDFVSTCWDDGDFEIDEEFSNECHDYMEKYSENWRSARREVAELITSRATSMMAMNAFDNCEKFSYTPTHDEFIRVLVKGDYYWSIIWEFNRYTQIVGKLSEDPSLLIVEHTVCESELIDIVKSAIDRNINLGYEEPRTFDARKIGYTHPKNVMKNLIYSFDILNGEKVQLEQERSLIASCQSKSDTDVLNEIAKLILNKREYQIYTTEASNNYLNLCEVYAQFALNKSEDANINPLIIATRYLYEYYLDTSHKDIKKAEKYYQIAADANYRPAVMELIHFYYLGQNFERDYEKAAYYSDIAIMLSSNEEEKKLAIDIKIQVEHSMLLQQDLKYLNSLNVQTVTKEELDKLLDISDSYYYGLKCFYGEFPTQFLDFASECNYASALAWKGYFLLTGYGYNQDVNKGLEMITKSQELDNNNPRIHFVLSNCYRRGLFGEVDGYLAVKHVTLSAEGGYTPAWGQLAAYHELELQGPQPKARFEAAEKGALCNELGGYVNLAECYESGIGTEVDLEKAYIYAKKAADLSKRWEDYYLKLKKLLNK